MSVVVSPRNGEWMPPSLARDVHLLAEEAVKDGYKGPYILVLSPEWRPFLNQQYMTQNDQLSLRQRIMQMTYIAGIAFSAKLKDYNIAIAQVVEFTNDK